MHAHSYIHSFSSLILDKLNINLKRENRDHEKYLNKVKIVEPCDSIIPEIPILTTASHITS